MNFNNLLLKTNGNNIKVLVSLRYRSQRYFLGPLRSIFVNEQLEFFWKAIRIIFLYLSETGREPVIIVESRRSNVPCFMWIGFRVLNGCVCNNRYWNNGYSIGFQYATNFGYSLCILFYVFQYMRCKNKIIGLIFKREIPQICLIIYISRIQISRSITSKYFSKILLEKRLWCKMYNRHFGKVICFCYFFEN